MESINANLISAQLTQMSSLISFNPTIQAGHQNQNFMNDIAASIPNMSGAGSKFDLISNNIAAFKDILSVAQNGISQMKEQGESIRDLIAQAQQEGVTPELLDKIQAEVDARVAEIQRIRDGANYNGINPFNGRFSLDIPDILGLMNAQNNEEAKGEITNMLASFDIDISIEGDGFSIGGSAAIEIGFTDDGALQITVDASMDYDFSGLLNKGVNSDDAMQMIENFISMLGVQQGDLGNAQNFMDAIFEQFFNLVNGEEQEPVEGITITPDTINTLKGQMTQQATITLDGMAGLSPNIAINIL